MCFPEMDAFIGAGVDGWMWTAALLDLDSLESLLKILKFFGYLNGNMEIILC